jgi:hypothetical protein
MGHIFLRSGEHYGIVRDEKVVAVVTDLDPDSIHVEGDKRLAAPKQPQSTADAQV